MVRRNLPPEAEPWGRTVDSRLDSIEKRLTKIDQDTSNSLQMISGQLTQVISQQRAIQTATEELFRQQETLDETVGQLKKFDMFSFDRDFFDIDIPAGFDTWIDVDGVPRTIEVPSGCNAMVTYGCEIARATALNIPSGWVSATAHARLELRTDHGHGPGLSSSANGSNTIDRVTGAGHNDFVLSGTAAVGSGTMTINLRGGGYVPGTPSGNIIISGAYMIVTIIPID